MILHRHLPVLSKALALWIAVAALPAGAGNPIIANRGVTDPHIHIFNGRAYLYATHDTAITYTNCFHMEDWWCWSSDDLVNWKLESVLKPEQTNKGAIQD